MLRLTDTHCHLSSFPLYRLPEIIFQAVSVGVNQMIVPAAEYTDWQTLLSLRTCSAVRAVALGIHPWFVAHHSPHLLAELANLLAQYPDIWVGEIGLDFYDKTLSDQQKSLQIEWFEQQLILANTYQRPVIIHQVKAVEQVAKSIKKIGLAKGGIAHAFSGSLEEANILLQSGLKIGLGSLLLNPHAKKVRQAAMRLPENSILLETDSPFMLPENTNTPANLARIARIVAELRNISVDQLAKICEKNLAQLEQDGLLNAEA